MPCISGCADSVSPEAKVRGARGLGWHMTLFMFIDVAEVMDTIGSSNLIFTDWGVNETRGTWSVNGPAPGTLDVAQSVMDVVAVLGAVACT